MNMNRSYMTETVKFKNYTNNFLQKDSNPTTMEVVTQTNAVKIGRASCRERVSSPV